MNDILTVRLIARKSEATIAGVEKLVEAGYKVDYSPFDGAAMKKLQQAPPTATLIDLSRSPAQGRDLGLILRKTKSTRHSIIVYIGGLPEKVAPIRVLLPDAFYSNWDTILVDLAEAITNPPVDPVVPDSVFAGYAGTPLPKKLGVKGDTCLTLVNSPQGFENVLGELPEGVKISHGLDKPGPVVLWFVRSRVELETGIEEIGDKAGAGRIWIIWPKKASGVKSDLSQNLVRRIGLDSGLVDYKIASIDQTWSGLCFTLRKYT